MVDAVWHTDWSRSCCCLMEVNGGPTLPAKIHPAVLRLSPHPVFVENAGVSSHPQWPKDKRTTGRAARDKILMKIFLKEFVQKRLPLQQNHFLPCYIHLQHSAGEKDECLSSAKKQTFDGYSENILQADFSWKLCVYSISDTEERYSWNLTRLVKQKSPGEASLIVTLKAKQTLDNTVWASDIELLASWCWFGFCMGSG